MDIKIPKVLRINSVDRNSSSISVSNCSFDLRESIKGIWKLRSCFINNSVYNVNGSNNLVYFNATVPTGSYTSILATGNYASSTLISQINTQMNAIASTGSFTGTYVSSLNKYNFINTNPFNFSFGSNQTNSAATLLGFSNIDTPSSANITSTNQINLSKPYSFNFMISNTVAITDTLSRGITFSVPNSVNSTSFIYFEPISNHIQAANFQSTSRLDIRITDDTGLLLDMNNVDWNLTLEQCYE